MIKGFKLSLKIYYKFLFLFLLTSQYGNAQLPPKPFIVWGDKLSLYYNCSGFYSRYGLYITASFSLKNEKRRSLRFYSLPIGEPKHAIVLVPKDGTFYILNLNTKKLIGQFTLPSRGAPKYIHLSPDENGFTKINYEFRILPPKGTRGRPGPLIEVELIYKDGMYLEQ